MTFWRGLFFLLVLANLVVFAWAQGYFGSRDEGREPGRMADQLHPDRVKIALAGKEPQPTPAPTVCKAVDGLAAKEADAVRGLLESRSDGGEALSLKLTPVAGAATFTVAISSLAGKAAADKKAGELRALGVTDFKLMEEGKPGAWTIVFGIFEAEQAAVEALAALNKKGVKSARIEAGEKPAEKARLEVRGPADLLARRLSATLAGTAGATVGDCP